MGTAAATDAAAQSSFLPSEMTEAAAATTSPPAGTPPAKLSAAAPADSSTEKTSGASAPASSAAATAEPAVADTSKKTKSYVGSANKPDTDAKTEEEEEITCEKIKALHQELKDAGKNEQRRIAK